MNNDMKTCANFILNNIIFPALDKSLNIHLFEYK